MKLEDCKSTDDLDAYFARASEDSRRWAEEYGRLKPELWFVLRHSGRQGQRWRVIFQSRDRQEAEEFFERKAYGGKYRAISYAATVLCYGGTDLFWHRVLRSGEAPIGTPYAQDGEYRSAQEREAREARQARRAKRRVAEPTVQPIRIAVQPIRVALVDEAAAEGEAVAVEQTEAARR